MADSRNITTKLTIENLAKQIKAGYATKAELPTKVSDLNNDSNFQTATQVEAAINVKVSATYKPGGTKTAADLVADLLVAANEGKVYDISTKLTITDDNKDLFVEGIKSSYPVGTNFVVINTGTTEAPAYKFDALAGFIDLSPYAEKNVGTTGNIVKLKADGSYEDAGIAASAVLTEHQDISGKADKPATATNGNVAKFDANKNPVDSGIAADDLQVKIASATNDNLVAMDADGKVKNSGIAGANVLTTADVSDYTEDEIAVLLGLKEASAG